MWLLNPYRFAAAYTPTDANAAAYIAAVEAADGQTLEAGVRQAIDAFVVGCKADGIWNAIKASCILSGARTLAGALVPLVGTAPTRFGTEGGWNYNRKTGLQGNGTNNYLNSNRAYNATPSNNEHLAIYKSTPGSGNQNFIGGGLTNPASLSRIAYILAARFDMQALPGDGYASANATGFTGASRSNSSTFNYRQFSATVSASSSSTARSNTATGYGVFGSNYGDLGPVALTDARLAFYSIGESLDLALLDARVTALVAAFAAAIP